MSRMQVSREIDKLKRLGLIEVQPQYNQNGGQRANLYILLNVSDEDEPVTHRYTPSNHELHPPVTESDTPHHRQSHKQDIENKTQTEQNTEEQPVVVAMHSNSETLLNQQTIETAETVRESRDDNRLSAALLARGLAEAVVARLVQQYSQAYLEEKLAYLTYLQATQPEKVLKPCGWLRKAIEDDYAAPDGYGSGEEQTDELIEVQHLEEVLQQEYAAQQRRKEEERIRQAQEANARLTHIQETYGTTERELNVWENILAEFKLTLPATTFTRYFADTLLLSLRNGEALIGLPDKYGSDWLANRFGKKLEQALASRLAGQPYTVKFVDLSLLSTQQVVA